MTDETENPNPEKTAAHPIVRSDTRPVRARDALADVERVYVGIPDSLTSEEIIRLQALVQSCQVTDKYLFEKEDEREEKVTRAILARAGAFEDYLRNGIEDERSKNHPSPS